MSDDAQQAFDDFFGATGVQQQADHRGSDLIKPWMKYHKFTLVKRIEEVRELVDRAIAHGRCALDLECEGLDNRIDFIDGKPQTRHKIVGYCMSVRGHGHYIPLGHKFDPVYDQQNPNLPVDEVNAEIKRLCLAAQPELTDEGMAEDPLASKKIKTPGKVVIFFWNAKFDQEFLYPVTGIETWHPESFECGHIAAYVLYTDDHALGLKPKAGSNLRIIEGTKAIPYEMIRFEDLFAKGIKKSEMNFADLYPEDGSPEVRYGCSDAICTELLCEPEPDKVDWEYAEVPGSVEYEGVVGRAKRGVYAGTYRLEKQTAQAVRLMERNRTKIDIAEIDRLLAMAEEELKTCDEKIQTQAKAKSFNDFNAGSPAQLAEFLFSERGLDLKPKPDKTATGQYKTDAATLEKLAERTGIPVLKLFVRRRQVEKVRSTYLLGMKENCDEEHQLRFNFKQTGAATGRFTAPQGQPDHGFSGIPVQGIPAKHDPERPEVANSLRRIFIAHDGYLMAKVDYAGQELRILANLSGEPLWTKEFLEGDGDLHTLTAMAFFPGLKPTDPDFKDKRKMGKCVHPDTLVPLPSGYAPIHRLGLFPEQPDTFADAKCYLQGDKPVTALYNGGVKPLVHVVISGGVVTCTPEHWFLLRDGQFTQARDLKPGDLLHESEAPMYECAQRYPELWASLWSGIPRSRYDLDHNLAYFAGAYVGDGSGNKSMARLHHGAVDKLDPYGDPYEDWVRVLEDACGRCGLTTTRKSDHSLYLGSRVLVRFLRELGVQRKREKNCRVPWWVLRGGRDAMLHFLGGLFDTDGTVGEDNHNLDWTTKDFVLAGQVGAVLRSCGLDFNVELTFNKTYQRYYTRLRLTVGSSWDMRSYMRYPGKLARLRAPLQAARTKDRFEVVKVLPAGEGPCLDITVGSEQHQYLANGFMTHNTANFALAYGGGVQAIMRATKCDKVEAARKKAAFDKSVPVFTKWLKGQHAMVHKNLGVLTAFRRFIAIPDANVKIGDIIGSHVIEDDGEVRKIQAGCERKSVNYPIQGSGADICKISLVRCHREFAKRNWLREGLDVVRMIMTVHDEIVFEIKQEYLMEAMALIKACMESPATMVGWKIPLIVEPLVGTHWGNNNDWDKMLSGKQPVPEELQPWFKPDAEVAPPTLPTGRGGGTPAPPPAAPPATPSPAPTGGNRQEAAPAPAPDPAGSMEEPATQVVTFAIPHHYVTRKLQRLVKKYIGAASPMVDELHLTRLLRLVDSDGGLLIDPFDPDTTFWVIPERFSQELRENNLGNGKWDAS